MNESAAAGVPAEIDTSRPHPARMYDYFIGGKNHFAADRETAAEVLRKSPSVRIAARENRAFLGRAVRYLTAEAGIRQFLDIGTGLPTANNVHEVAQSHLPSARVVYVDNDPLVLAHARALLTSSPEGRTAYIHADLRDPAAILSDPVARDLLDFSQPIALMLVAILHFLPDENEPAKVIATLLDALPPGSYLAASHLTMENDPQGTGAGQRVMREAGIAMQKRHSDEFARLAFSGLELVPPGVVLVSEWRPDVTGPRPTPAEVSCYGGVARKPLRVSAHDIALSAPNRVWAPSAGTAEAVAELRGRGTMRAVVYKGPFQVAVENVDDPKIEHPNDVIVKLTSTAICGSDLHMYEGRTAAKPGIIFGHENLGIVQETGPGVVGIKQGDRVVMPFNVACGFCKNCTAGYTAFCLTVNPGFAGGAYGYVAMGPYRGGQAEYLRVPFADFNCLKLPPGQEHEDDFVLLADIFPTGYHGCELAQVSPGESVAVYGAGPVGLMSAYSALLRGASKVFVVDRVPERLDKAREIGAIPINFSEADPVGQIKDQTAGEGTDKGIDAVGYQARARDSDREEPALVLNSLIETVRATGMIGVTGLYVPTDPGGPSEEAKHGMLLAEVGRFFEKGQRMGMGQANVKQYIRQLRDLIIEGRAKPSFVVSNDVGLDKAPEAYDKFDKRIEGYTKVVLHPAA